MNKNVELFYEPGQILRSLPSGDKSEMSGRQLAFLCGLIKQERPRKILEIGVSSGATTAVLLNCISMLNLKTEIFSLDLAEDYTYDKSKKVGYVIDEYKALSRDEQPYMLFTGAYAVEHLEEIGDHIDFLILDTVHKLPGEILDFLACYPYLERNAVVVLHDIILNHFGSNDRALVNNANDYATKILFDVAAADKFIDIDKNNALSNIGAFKINDDTSKYIENLFSVMSITWTYRVSDEEMHLYRNFYSRYYSEDMLGLFDMAVNLNRKSFAIREQQKKEDFINILKIGTWVERLKSKNVYIYGCGIYGQHLRKMLEQLDIAFGGYIISDGQKMNAGADNLNYLSNLCINGERDLILIGVNKALHGEIGARLQERGIKEGNILFPDEWMYDYLS